MTECKFCGSKVLDTMIKCAGCGAAAPMPTTVRVSQEPIFGGTALWAPTTEVYIAKSIYPDEFFEGAKKRQ